MSKPNHQLPFSAKLKNTPPKKPKNKDCRSREYLTISEVEKLRKTARNIGRHGVRDDTRAIQSYLGHANIRNTVIYTAYDAKNEFKEFPLYANKDTSITPFVSWIEKYISPDIWERCKTAIRNTNSWRPTRKNTNTKPFAFLRIYFLR